MKASAELLALPATAAARLIGLDLLDKLDKARDHLGDKEDTEALHDFRVALRRLRSWLRAFRAELPDLRREPMRELGRLADITSESRDLEVKLEWLAGLGEAIDEETRAAAEWLSSRLRKTMLRADKQVERQVQSGFEPMRKRLRRDLSTYTVPVQPEAALPQFGPTTAALITDHCQEIRDALAAVQSVADQPQAHAARIAGKRLRYLLEPLREIAPEATGTVERMAA